MPRAKTGTVTEINGIVYAKVTFTDASGKRRQKYRRARNRSDAHAKKRQMLNELESAGREAFDGERMTFAEAAAAYAAARLVEAEYRDERKVAGLRDVATARQRLAVLVAYFGQRRLRSVTAGDLDTFRRDRLATDTKRGRARAVATVNRELALLRALLNHAHREGWILRNPFQHAPKALISAADEVKRDRVISRDEEARLLAACSGPRAHLRPIVVCALDTGMRRGEIFKLRWPDVDLEGATITVRKLNTKTLKGRTIGVTPRLKEELERLWWAAADKSHGLVFGVETNVAKSWAGACRKAGVSGLRFHDLRASAITRMIRSGLPHFLVMRVSGHENPTTFLRYVRLNEEFIHTAAQALADLNERESATPENTVHGIV